MPRQTSVRHLVTRLDGSAEEREAFLAARDKVGDRDIKPEKFSLPEIPALRRVARRIDSEDEAELRWYLRDPQIASIAASSGAFGNQLDQAASFGFGALPCKRCG